MTSPHKTHIRNLLNMFNYIIDHSDPLGIIQGQIAQFERNFTTPTQPLYLYIDPPKEDPQRSFIKSTFTLASHHPLITPNILLEVYCPCIDLGSSGVVLPRGVEFSASTSSTPRRVSFPVQAKDCKKMDEKECKNNPDICLYRRVKGGKRVCAARPGTLKQGAPKTKKQPLPYTSRYLLEEFKLRVLDYLPDLIGTTSNGLIHVLPHDHSDLTPYTHLEVVKRFTITGNTKFGDNLTSIEGGPVLLVGDMTNKFRKCTSFNSPVDRWDVSQITNMKGMFIYASAFNQPLQEWNVSGVKDMEGIFAGTTFNQPLQDWDTGQVTNMYGMFANATTFNQPLHEWNVSKVKNMGSMFFGASAFNQPLYEWNVSGVKNMGSMFDIAATFNQPLQEWNVSGVDDMGSMFKGATTFNQPLQEWNVSGVKDMGGMFTGATTFNQPLGQWNVSQVNYMSFMFHGATTFNQPLRGWNVSGVTDMGSMFYGATAFNQLLGMWDPKDVIYMDDMFDMSSMEILPKWYTDFYSGYW